MSDDQVLERVMAFMQGRFPGKDIAPDDDIFALGFVNSMFAMELVVFVESTFGFAVPAEELRLENFRKASSVTALVVRNLGLISR